MPSIKLQTENIFQSLHVLSTNGMFKYTCTKQNKWSNIYIWWQELVTYKYVQCTWKATKEIARLGNKHMHFGGNHKSKTEV